MHHHHPHNPYHDPPPHKEDLTKNPAGETEKTGGEGSVRGKVAEVELEMVVEEPRIEERITEGEVEGEDVYSGATEVLSEGGTEVIKSGEEKNAAEKVNEEEEVVQPVGNREEVILLADDEDINEEEQPTEVPGQRPSGHRDSPVGQMDETLATSGWMAGRGIGSELTKETATQEERQEEVPTREAEAEEERLRRERKRKGKQIARPVKNKVKQASRNVVIQEPVQAPHGVTRDEAEAGRGRGRVEIGAQDQEEVRRTSVVL